MGLPIGISGKAGSGKDTVANILQAFHYLEMNDMWGTEELTEHNLPSIIKAININPKLYMFKVIKFADPLKQIVAIMLGVTVEQLEEREFKESQLGEEWWKYCNVSNTNDSTILDITMIAYNEKSKEVYHKNTPLLKLTPRNILQLMGTEVVRNIHPNAWVNIAMKKVSISDKIVLIPDMRFRNEMKAIEARNGITIRVNRKVETGNHASETELDNESFNFIIENDGTMKELIQQCKGLYHFIKENCI